MKLIYKGIIVVMLVCAAAYADDAGKSASGDNVKKDEIQNGDSSKKDREKSGDNIKNDTAGDTAAGAGLPAEFAKLLKLTGMSFTMPADFTAVEVDILKCQDVNYFHAIKHREKKLEVRYVIIPFRQPVKSETKIMPGSDSIYRISANTIAANIAGDESNILKTVEFKTEDVKNEFHADWGTTSVMKPDSGFGDGYKFAVITSLYRSGRGEAYIIFLFDNYKDISREYDEAFYTLMYIE